MSKRLRAGGIVLLLTAVLVIGSLLFRQWAEQPVGGTLRTGAPTRSTAPDTPETSADIQNDYFTATLPAGFEIKRQTTQQDGSSLQRLVASDKRQQLAITVATLPPEGLTGAGNYNLRAKDATNYQPYNLTDMPAGATTFRSVNNPPAFVVFWPNGDRYAEIALTSDGAATLDELTASFSQIIQTWQWQ